MQKEWGLWSLGSAEKCAETERIGDKGKKCQYKEVINLYQRYGAEAFGMRNSERRKVNVLEMKCLRRLVVVSRLDRAWNEEVRVRAGIEIELVRREDQRALRWLGHVEGTG